MSTGAKVWSIVIVLIIIVGGVWWWHADHAASSGMSDMMNTPATDNPGLTTSPSDDSNAALDQDMTSVSGQMNGLDSDQTQVDQTLSATSTQ